jgi:phenylalanyl-tRNA synthetase beta chain
MKVSLEWLSQFVDGPLEMHEVADALTMGGLTTENFSTVGPDTVLDVEVTSNRPDCLSVLGVAREVAALMGRTFLRPALSSSAGQGVAPISVTIENPADCPHLAMQLIKGVKVAPSPAWMQRRLQALGQRPINNLVDITNYVLLEMGKPLHVFDHAKLQGGTIGSRKARAGESIQLLDGKTYKLEPWMVVIADGVAPVALAGIMGGELSSVNEQTVDVLIESARFEPLLIRKTARTLALASDSSYRFERGLDPTSVINAMHRCVQLILELAGGTVTGPIVEAGSTGYSPAKLSMRAPRFNALIGVDWTVQKCAAALTKLSLNPVAKGEVIEVDVPSHRLDLRIEADLIEEVARITGYGEIPTRDQVAIRLTPTDTRRSTLDNVRRCLNAAGFYESLTFSFVPDVLAEDFKHAAAARLHKVLSATRKVDAQLRPSVLPNLLQSVRHNESVGTSGARLFEIASTFWIDAAGKSLEQRIVGMVGDDDFAHLRGAVEAILNRLDRSRVVSIVPTTRAGYVKGGVGEVRWGGTLVGYVGKVDRGVCEKIGLKSLVSAAELFVEELIAGAVHVPQLVPLPKYPAVRRDLSLLVNESVRYEEILGVVGKCKLEALESVDYVTTYRGKPLEKGTKSVTITLGFRSPDGTLTSEAVDAKVAAVVEVAKSIGATLRT